MIPLIGPAVTAAAPLFAAAAAGAIGYAVGKIINSYLPKKWQKKIGNFVQGALGGDIVNKNEEDALKMATKQLEIMAKEDPKKYKKLMHVISDLPEELQKRYMKGDGIQQIRDDRADTCLLYTSPSPRDLSTSRMQSSA